MCSPKIKKAKITTNKGERLLNGVTIDKSLCLYDLFMKNKAIDVVNEIRKINAATLNGMLKTIKGAKIRTIKSSKSLKDVRYSDVCSFPNAFFLNNMLIVPNTIDANIKIIHNSI